MHDLEKKVLELIGEDTDSPDAFSDITPIRDALNDAIQEIVMVTGSHKRTYYIPFRANQQFYKILLDNGYVGWVTDAWALNRKRRLEQTGIVKLTRHDVRWMIASSDPVAYFQVGDYIGLYPKPSGTTDTLEVQVVEIPKAYTDDRSRIKLKSDFEYAAVHFAVSEFWASRGDAREALLHYERYREKLGLSDDYQTEPGGVRRLRTSKEPWPKETA